MRPQTLTRALSWRLGPAAASSLSTAVLQGCSTDIEGEISAPVYRFRLGEEGTMPAVVAAQSGTPLQQGSALVSFWSGRLFSSLALPQVAIDTTGSSSEGGDCSNGGNGSITASSPAQQQTQRRGRPKSEAPAYDPVQLLRSLGLEGGDPVKLRRSLDGLAGARQERVLHHAASVTEYLRGLGLSQAKLEQLFVRCPQLFSWPVEERAAKQFDQLLHADGNSGLTAAEAVLCFLKRPTAARSPEYRFAELAAILAHSKDSSMGPKPKVLAAQRTVAALLRNTPSAVHLVCMPEGKLQRQVDRLVRKGCTHADVAKLVWYRPFFFWSPDITAKLDRAIDVLGSELGLAAADLVTLVGSRAPSWLGLPSDILQGRAVELAQVFGKGPAASMVSKNFESLGCPPHVWQCNLHYIAACGVADPVTVLTRNPGLLPVNHAADGFVARRLLLQRYYRHTPEQLYEKHSGLLTVSTAKKLAHRLQYVECLNQLHLLPAGVAANLGCSGQAAASAGAEHAGGSKERVLSLTTLMRNWERCLAVVGSSKEEWEMFAAGHPEGTGPVWEWAQREAQLESWRLKSVLPAELRKVADGQPKRYYIKTPIRRRCDPFADLISVSLQ